MEKKKVIEAVSGWLLVAGAATGSMIFLFSTFATIALVQAQGAAATQYTDQKFSEVVVLLKEQGDRLKTIDQRTWEMNGRRGPSPEKL